MESVSDSPLAPTPIVDKNGKQTTVLKKQSRPASASPLASVKPTVTQQDAASVQYGVRPGAEFADRGVAAKWLLEVMNGKGSRRLTTVQVNAMIAGLHPDTLSTLDRIAATWKHGWLAPNQAARLSVKEESIASFNNTAFFHNVPEHPEAQRLYVAYISGLQAYHGQGEPPVDYSFAPALEQQRARALLKAALELSDHIVTSHFRGSLRTSLRSPHLAALISSRPEDIDRLIAIVQNRTDLRLYSEDDAKALDEMLDQNVATPLIDGVL